MSEDGADALCFAAFVPQDSPSREMQRCCERVGACASLSGTQRDNGWSDQDMPVTRPPRTTLEIVTANSRPQPAIPAVLVLMICGLFAGAAVQAGGGSFVAWALTAGLLASAGLAIAAGFCSVFPTLAWIGLAWLLLGSSAPELALHTRLALGFGTFASAAMTLFQIWRVRTRRFVPTITEDSPGQP